MNNIKIWWHKLESRGYGSTSINSKPKGRKSGEDCIDYIANSADRAHYLKNGFKLGMSMMDFKSGFNTLCISTKMMNDGFCRNFESGEDKKEYFKLWFKARGNEVNQKLALEAGIR